MSRVLIKCYFFFSSLLAFRWWQVPYYWVGIKCYDLVAGDRNVKSSYYLSKQDALELFPMLKKDKLCGAIVYYDGRLQGQFALPYGNYFIYVFYRSTR